MNMLSELRNRGILDACIVCCDGLKGLPDAIGALRPQATIQTCVVHLVRNSLRYTARRDWKQITAELKAVYNAESEKAAEHEFDAFAERWGARYAALINLWRGSWTEFVPFLGFPTEIRRLIYTTNGIESLNARFRAATRRRGHFPDEQSALKVLYLPPQHREKNRPNPTGRITTTGPTTSTSCPDLWRPPGSELADGPYTEFRTGPLMALTARPPVPAAGEPAGSRLGAFVRAD